MSLQEVRPIVKWHIPPIFQRLLRPRRYKIIFGGRGGGKTQTLATIIVGLLYSRQPIEGQPFRVLCGREYQNTIADSVHFEIIAAIQRLNLLQYFRITQSGIVCTVTGAQVLYRGIHNNIAQIKSLGGIDLFWGEEAHSFTADSLKYIYPTIRRDPPFGPFGKGSELWYSFNQTLDEDPVYVRFRCSEGAREDERTLVLPCTYKDNYTVFRGPMAMDLALATYPNRDAYPLHKFIQDKDEIRVITFPQVLEDDRSVDEQSLPREEYEWTWGTQCRNLGGIFFALKDLLVRDEPPEYPPICDTVFAVIDTAVKTSREHDATAVIFVAVTQAGAGIPLMILDWDIQQIQGSMLEVWLPSVFMRLQTLATECKARFNVGGVFIEDKSSGSILLQQASKMADKGRAFPIESKLTAMGKVERAIAASPYVCRGAVKVTKPAYDKVVTYKGRTANHLLTQIRSFRVGDTELGECDLLDCFGYSVVIALGNAEGM